MKIWKQLIISMLLVAVLFGTWIYTWPDAQKTMESYGLGFLAFANREKPAEGGAKPGPANAGGKPAVGGRPSRDTLVVAGVVGENIVNNRLSAIGTGQAARTVIIRPVVSGQIATIPVSSGSLVNAGDVLIELDSKTELLALERAELALKTASDKSKRFESLRANRAVSSVEADAAITELNVADLSVRDARLALERRTIKAPISGSLGILSINPGDYVTPQTDITTIDDRSEILVEFYVPERFARLMTTGAEIEAIAISRPGEKFLGKVVATDNRIDEASRTLRVRASIPNEKEGLRSGMSFEIRMDFPGETYPMVDPLAIQWDSNGSYVWKIEDAKVERVSVSIIQRNPDSVLVKTDLAAGDLVVTEGVQSVRSGGAVKIAGTQGDEKALDTKPEAKSGPKTGQTGS